MPRPTDRTLAVWAKATYAEPEARQNVVQATGGELVADIAGGQALVVDYQDTRVIVYRGTATLGEWVSNLRRGHRQPGTVPVFRGDRVPPDTDNAEPSDRARRRQAKDPATLPGQAHRGFLRQLAELWPDIEPYIDAVSAGDRIYAGHSLGGALAQLTAYWRQCRRVVTWGSPQVGNAELCDSIDKQSAAIVQREGLTDPVPRVPIFGYQPTWRGRRGVLRYWISQWGHSMTRYARNTEHR